MVLPFMLIVEEATTAVLMPSHLMGWKSSGVAVLKTAVIDSVLKLRLEVNPAAGAAEKYLYTPLKATVIAESVAALALVTVL